MSSHRLQRPYSSRKKIRTRTPASRMGPQSLAFPDQGRHLLQSPALHAHNVWRDNRDRLESRGGGRYLSHSRIQIAEQRVPRSFPRDMGVDDWRSYSVSEAPGKCNVCHCGASEARDTQISRTGRGDGAVQTRSGPVLVEGHEQAAVVWGTRGRVIFSIREG